MKTLLLKLWRDEEGAELVEWIIVVAAIAGIAVAVYSAIKGNVITKADEIINGISTE